MGADFYELDFEAVYRQFNNLVKFAAKSTMHKVNNSGDNNCISAEDLYQEGQEMLYICFEKYRLKSMEEFGRIFKVSLWRCMHKKAFEDKGFVTVDLAAAYGMGYNDEKLDDMFLEYGLQQIVTMLKDEPVALAVFEEIINPSPRTLWEMHMDKCRKEMMKSQGYKVNSNSIAKVKMKHIIRALGITEKMYDNAKFKLKQVVEELYPKQPVKQGT